MWAGRLCRQKNVELLIEIARHSQSFRYQVFGSGEPEYSNKVVAASQSLGNLVSHGSYASFSELPTVSFGAFLYTTLWDGLPNVLLAAGASGLPTVAPSIGGISELVDEKTGWLIKDHSNPIAYVDALEEIKSNPTEATRRTSAMRERLKEFHSWDFMLKPCAPLLPS